MTAPRVLVQGVECAAWAGLQAPAADVLIVCGQGVYADGVYYGEFHDRDIYFEHALRWPEIAARFNYNLIVTSGGFTQSRAPWLSEAESVLRIMADAGVALPAMPVVLDEAALDSAENLLLGLMTARLALGDTPIRRVGIWAAWQFKKWRFNRNAEALGIVERTYFHGLAPASQTNVQVPPDDARQRSYNEYREDVTEYGLLLDADREKKRQRRWQNSRCDSARDPRLTAWPAGSAHWQRDEADGAPQVRCDGLLSATYAHRHELFAGFSATQAALAAFSQEVTPERAHDLAAAFGREVIKS